MLWCPVLLEKSFDNLSIDKLWATCLLEADFNWWLKIIFAKQMVHHMHTAGIIPIEQEAIAGKTIIDISMLK